MAAGWGRPVPGGAACLALSQLSLASWISRMAGVMINLHLETLCGGFGLSPQHH